MDILNPRLRARRVGGYWDFWIYYTAVFRPEELGTVFADRVEYWEYDPDFWDKLGSSNWDFFTPRNQLEDVEWKMTVHEDVVDTEWGDEEIRGVVYLARPGTNGISRYTPIVEGIDA